MKWTNKQLTLIFSVLLNILLNVFPVQQVVNFSHLLYYALVQFEYLTHGDRADENFWILTVLKPRFLYLSLCIKPKQMGPSITQASNSFKSYWLHWKQIKNILFNILSVFRCWQPRQRICVGDNLVSAKLKRTIGKPRLLLHRDLCPRGNWLSRKQRTRSRITRWLLAVDRGHDPIFQLLINKTLKS